MKTILFAGAATLAYLRSLFPLPLDDWPIGRVADVMGSEPFFQELPDGSRRLEYEEIVEGYDVRTITTGAIEWLARQKLVEIETDGDLLRIFLTARCMRLFYAPSTHMGDATIGAHLDFVADIEDREQRRNGLLDAINSIIEKLGR